MACGSITRGRLEQCNDSVGGIEKIELASFGSITGVTYDVTDTDVITSLEGSITWYEYELDNNSNTFSESLVSDRDAGTTYFESTLNVTLKKLDKDMHNELKLIAYDKPHIRVTDRNGNAFIVGLTRGTKLTSGDIQVGGALGDFSGYNLVFTGMEPVPSNFYTGS